MRITPDLVPHTYSISKKVYEGKLTHTDGVKLLVGDGRMNKNSAADYINNFKYLMEGQRFTRTNNAFSIDYFLEHILQDYGASKLAKALLALNQHIKYYEDLPPKAKMHKMRGILKKYSARIDAVALVQRLDELIVNILTIEDYLADGSVEERVMISRLIEDGICFIAYEIDGELRFAPSKFLGYARNTLQKHIPSDTDGRETNNAIKKILKASPAFSDSLEAKYLSYCQKLGINPHQTGGGGNLKRKRKYWTLTLEEVTEGFPEGRIVERIHKARERNSPVVQLAKLNFKRKHGRLFCQICAFDFEKRYGQIGADFIEGHHTIPVSEMSPDHKTRPEDIAMLCSNCHRMVHKKRPWLAMDDLSSLIR